MEFVFQFMAYCNQLMSVVEFGAYVLLILACIKYLRKK